MTKTRGRQTKYFDMMGTDEGRAHNAAFMNSGDSAEVLQQWTMCLLHKYVAWLGCRQVQWPQGNEILFWEVEFKK